jgi:hypothetical protein
MMTDEELATIEARHRHDHAEEGGGACPWCEQDVPALLGEVRRLRTERLTEREALEELLPCQCRFSHRDRPFDLNVRYSVGRLVETVAALEDALRRERARR